jgi:hypothetical protein
VIGVAPAFTFIASIVVAGTEVASAHGRANTEAAVEYKIILVVATCAAVLKGMKTCCHRVGSEAKDHEHGEILFRHRRCAFFVFVRLRSCVPQAMRWVSQRGMN